MKCVILQPSYIPWLGYFDQIRKADVFVFYDDVPYDRRGWRNRNRIKAPGGSRWLTIPVRNKGTQADLTPILDIRINWDRPWNRSHREAIRHAYGKAPYYQAYAGLLDRFFDQRPDFLVDLTIPLTVALAEAIGIEGKRYVRSSELSAEGRKTDRLLSVLAHLGATHYISGPSAREYIEAEKFVEAGVGLEYMKYDYPPYPQLHGAFDPRVSIVDLLFMTGPEAPNYFAPG